MFATEVDHEWNTILHIVMGIPVRLTMCITSVAGGLLTDAPGTVCMISVIWLAKCCVN